METSTDRTDGLRALRWPLRLTWAGMLAEALVQAFWPVLALVLTVLAALMMGAQDALAGGALWAALAIVGLAALSGLFFALRRFRLPSRAAALARSVGEVQPHTVLARSVGTRGAGRARCGRTVYVYVCVCIMWCVSRQLAYEHNS